MNKGVLLDILKKIRSSLILITIILFHLINTFIWLRIDKSYLKLDAWGHYRYSLEVYEFLKSIAHLNLPISAVEPMKWHGLLVGFITAPFYFIFGSAQDTAIIIINSIFSVILILSTYGIGKKLLNKEAGLLAVFILTSYPLIFNNLRIYMLDLPLTGMVALSLYFLISCDNFTDRKNSLLFCLSLGLGFLIKFNYLAFIIGPFTITFYNALIKKDGLCKKVLKHIIYVSIAIIFICIIFYLIRSTDVLHRILQTSYLGVFKDKDFYFSDFLKLKFIWLLKYIEISIEQGTSFLFLIAFGLGLWFFIKLKFKNRWIIYLTLIIPLFIQVFLLLIPPECMVRYCMPFSSTMAVISAVGITVIKQKKFKKILISLLIPLGIIQFFAISYGIPILPKKTILPLRFGPYNFNMVFFEQNIGIPPFLQDKTSHPSLANWKSTEVLNIILLTNPTKERIKVVSLSNVPELFEAMEYQILSKRELIDFIPAISITIEQFYDNRTISLDKILPNAHYVIISNNTNSLWENVFNSDSRWKNEIERTRKVFYDNITNYKLIGVEPLPDGNSVLIYKNICNTAVLKTWVIKHGDVKFLFDGGRGRIFYKDTEITKGLGLYSSLFSLQHWRDSMEAAWNIIKISDTAIIAKGRWMFIPISEIWKIELREGNIIDWQVEIEVHDKIKIEIEDFKLMLSEKYNDWFVSDGKKGKFSDYFEKNLWEKLWVGNINNEVCVKAIDTADINLPTVKFHALNVSSEFLASIEDSDQLFNGRVIGCFKKNQSPNNIFSPGSYKHFSAEISIQ